MQIDGGDFQTNAERCATEPRRRQGVMMEKETLNKPVGKKMLRLFGQLGATFCGLWALGGVIKTVALLANGETGDAFVQAFLGQVLGPIFVLVFFLWAFQKGRTPS